MHKNHFCSNSFAGVTTSAERFNVVEVRWRLKAPKTKDDFEGDRLAKGPSLHGDLHANHGDRECPSLH